MEESKELAQAATRLGSELRRRERELVRLLRQCIAASAPAIATRLGTGWKAGVHHAGA